MKKIISILVMACMLTGCAGLKPDEMVKTDIQDNAVSTGTDISEGWENQEEGVLQQDEKEKQSGSRQSFISRHWFAAAVSTVCIVSLAFNCWQYRERSKTQKEPGQPEGQTQEKAQLQETIRQAEEALPPGEGTLLQRIEALRRSEEIAREDKRKLTEDKRELTERINGIKNRLPAVVLGDVTEEGGSAEERAAQANVLLGEGGQDELLQRIGGYELRVNDLQRSVDDNQDTMRGIAATLQEIKASWVDSGPEEETPTRRVLKVAEVVREVVDDLIQFKYVIQRNWPGNPIFTDFLGYMGEAEPKLGNIMRVMIRLITSQQGQLVQALADNQTLQARLAPAAPAEPD